MWLDYSNEHFCSLSFECTSSRNYNYHFDYFPFLQERLKDIDGLYFLGFEVKRRFIMVTPQEYQKLKVYDDLLKNINYSYEVFNERDN